MKLTIKRDYCRCGEHCKKYGMNAYYCRKQWLKEPTKPTVTVIFPSLIKTAPKNIQEWVETARQIKKELGKVSVLVLMRKLKITQKQAQEILEYV